MRTAEIQPGPEAPISSEIPLSGKTAIITGGSRDVGAGIVKALTLEGVRVVFSYRNKKKRADEVIGEVEAEKGLVSGLAVDISTPEGRGEFFESAVEILGGRVDYLILGTSGPTPQLNELASNDLLDRALPHMKPGGTVIRLQSVPGHFMPQLRGSFSLGKYDNVAQNKYPDLKSLRVRTPEMDRAGVRFIEICPPIVSGTHNVNFARRIDPTADEQHFVVSDNLGLPRAVTAQQVGEKVAELLKNPDTKQGHTEFFNGILDVQTALEGWYDVAQVYVNTLQMQEDMDGSRRGIGRAIASFDQVTRAGDPRLVDEIKNGVLTIGPEHAQGHFSQESGFPQIFPGHKQIRVAIEAVGLNIKSETGAAGVRLAGFNRAVFEKTVIANGNTKIEIKQKRNPNGTYDVEIFRVNDGVRFSYIEGMSIIPTDEPNPAELLEDQALEGAAQTVGVVGAEGFEENKMPLLIEIGKTEFLSGGIKAGEGVSYDAMVQPVGKGQINGSVVIHSEGRIIGAISGIRTVLVSRRFAARLLASQV